MSDLEIIDMYFARNESAITETDTKYGAFCRGISMNILSVYEDVEECVNDTYNAAWNNIPPQRPDNFRAWLGRIVRNISINLYSKNRAKKRFSSTDVLLSELEECIPASGNVECEIETKELADIINTWLGTLDTENRVLFIRRYWYGSSLSELASKYKISASKLAQRMYRLRQSLKSTLEKEGVVL